MGQQSNNKIGKGRRPFVDRSRVLAARTARGRGKVLDQISRIAPGDTRVVCCRERHGNGASKGRGRYVPTRLLWACPLGSALFIEIRSVVEVWRAAAMEADGSRNEARGCRSPTTTSVRRPVGRSLTIPSCGGALRAPTPRARSRASREEWQVVRKIVHTMSVGGPVVSYVGLVLATLMQFVS